MEKKEAAGAPQENKMGVMPVGKLLLNMSLPMMASMLVQALYNVVDSVFVSRVSENAFTAVSLAFPIQTLMIALCAGTAVGINALLSRSLGEKNLERARSAALNGVFLAAMGFVAFFLIGVFVAPVFFRAQTDVAEIVEGGIAYLRVCCCASFGLFFGLTFDRLLQSTGRTLLTMYTQLLGAVLNIVLDPIMIFGLFGFPALGVAGAAVATVVGQICGMLLSFWFCRTKNPEVPLNFRGFRPEKAVIAEIYRVGVPSIVMQSIGSVMTFGFNQILIGFSTTAAAVFGAYFKLQSFIFMPVFGLNNGLVPIIAYNYGARRADRIKEALCRAILYAMCIMAVGVMLFQLVPGTLLQLFDPSADMLALGIPALRIISISFVPAAFCIVCGSMFQALGSAVYSMINSVTRQLVVLLPVAWLLSRTGVLDLVWLSFPIAEVASVVLSIVFLRRILKKKINPLTEE
ncbi:MAG: MATE family efflux transporter [Ruminococcaceae bacterium]|nr:MATE family efflux transporter [Oscillospiraceae bacterium]